LLPRSRGSAPRQVAVPRHNRFDFGEAAVKGLTPESLDDIRDTASHTRLAADRLPLAYPQDLPGLGAAAVERGRALVSVRETPR